MVLPSERVLWVNKHDVNVNVNVNEKLYNVKCATTDIYNVYLYFY